MKTTPKLWEATYEARTDDELMCAYGNWADLYDRDTCNVMGYVGPSKAADQLDRHLPTRNCRVLDAGCGTGLVGEALCGLGYSQLDAMDLSKDMLKEADKKGLYQHLITQDMNQQLNIPDNTYDATICVGTFTYAHVGPHVFEELVRVTRPGGYISFTVRDGAFQKYGYRDKMLEMEADNQWSLKELKDDDYLVKEEVSAKFFTYQVKEGCAATSIIKRGE
ncbi:MAG TPA: class I SAM-dependent methyltransferase [Desulfobacter sp.]|nr:class I SAM-dependent methyltransferase [Desulfobacter sp.]